MSGDALTVDDDDRAVAVEFYSLAGGGDSAARGALRRLGALGGALGFVAGAAFVTDDRSRLAVYHQWSRRAGSDEYRSAWALGQLEGLARDESHLYEVVAREPHDRPTTVTADSLYAFGEFWVEPENQAELVARERDAAVEAVARAGFTSANFHRGLLGTRTVNLAQMSDPGVLTALTKRAWFAPETAYFRGLARNSFHAYHLRGIVAV